MTSLTSPSPGGRRYAGKEPGQRHAERYRRLVEAGLEVIGTHGYRAASVKSVCQEAGLTERYFYQCFRNREDLLVAVYEDLNRLVRTRTMAAVAASAGDLDAMARAGAESYFSLLKADPRVARVLLFEAVGVSPRMARVNREAEARFVELIREGAQRRQRVTKMGATRETMVAAGLVGASVNIAMRWVLDDYRQPLEDVVASMVLIHEAVSDRLYDAAD